MDNRRHAYRPDDSDTTVAPTREHGVTVRPSLHSDPERCWRDVAQATRRWAQETALPLRELVVLVPSTVWIEPMRRALAAEPGWQPRVETTRTLADSLGPPPPPGPGPRPDDPVHDRLQVAALLRSLPFGAAWERRDRRDFMLAVAATAEAAAELAQRAASLDPLQRAAFWARARAGRQPAQGPGALQAHLLQVALAWAEGTEELASDRLFDHRPGGWVLVRLGGGDDAAEQLLARPQGPPSLTIDLDPPAGQEFDALGSLAPADLVLCDDLAAEVMAAASAVIEHLNAGRAPVALVALDRMLARRVRALLEEAGARVADETGWRLSTTRAAARLMAWLRAAAGSLRGDDLLDWLKDWPPAQAQPMALAALESHWRRFGLGAVGLPPEAQDLWQVATQALAGLRAATPRVRPLTAWLEEVARGLHASGEWERLADDPAGRELLRVLRLDAAAASAWGKLGQETSWPLAGFVAWVDEVLEGASFRPEVEQPEVVLTPLVYAPLRAFGAVVMPGADLGGLGRAEPATGLIGETQREELGLITLAEQRRRQRLAWCQLLRSPHLTVIRRRLDGDEPLAPSPEIEALDLSRRRRGLAGLVARPWSGLQRMVEPRPVQRPAPTAPHDLPSSLSASQVEALRACPYRFFARAVLRLREDEELERSTDKRDYGNWLHGVLHRFHLERPWPPHGDDRQRLAAAAQAQLAADGIEAADLLPYLASFEAFAPAYLDWLQASEQAGWRWQQGELPLQAAPAALAPSVLRGRIDRIDLGPDGVTRLIDYKTGSAASLVERMKPLSEDTQLAFYAALLASDRPRASLEAAYLTLDDAQSPTLLAHDGVEATAAQLIEGLGAELARLRAGAGMPALGEGSVCEHCEVRGLCRRDHWGAAAEPEPPP